MKNRAGVLLIALLLLAGLTITVTRALDFGVGWTGVFYNNTSFSGNATATISGINGLNFNWPAVPSINGVRWRCGRGQFLGALHVLANPRAGQLPVQHFL